MKIYLYWYGNNEILEKIKNNCNEIEDKCNGIKFIIGPTNDEHQTLLKTSKFYFDNFNKNKIAFCSDYYRIWKMRNEIEKCIYMDATMIINKEKILGFVKKILNYDSFFVRENYHIIWNGLFMSNSNDLYENILSFYDNYPKICSKLTGPLIFSIFVYKKYGTTLKKVKDTLFLDSRDIDYFDKENVFRYNGFGSWGKNKEIDMNNPISTGAHDYFHKNAMKFNKKENKFWILIRWFIKWYLLYLLPIILIKKFLKAEKNSFYTVL